MTGSSLADLDMDLVYPLRELRIRELSHSMQLTCW
jgi:hypothetical protein